MKSVKIVKLRGGRVCKTFKNQTGFEWQSESQKRDETSGSSELLGSKVT